MINYILKKKIEKETQQHTKKLMMFTGAVLASVGAVCAYKSIKRRLDEFEDFELEEFENDFDEEEYIKLFDESLENEQMKEKVDEFNSRRITSKNCIDSSQREMQSFIDKAKDENIEIDEIAIDEDEE
jgi:hypothetical protein